LLVVLLLLLCLGGVLYYLFGRDKDKGGTPVATSSPSVTATSPSASPSVSPSVSPSESGTGTIGNAIPDVVGKSAAEAEEILQSAGFTTVTFTSGDNPDDPVQILSEWTVTNQTPAAGQKVDPKTEIVLTVTKKDIGKG
jgi:beta-lactam-binding protein with PASTA domain